MELIMVLNLCTYEIKSKMASASVSLMKSIEIFHSENGKLFIEIVII